MSIKLIISILLFVFLFSFVKGQHLASSLPPDKDLLKKYEAELRWTNADMEVETIRNVISIMQAFNERKLDSTRLIIGNIDGDGMEDTITNRVYLLNNTVYVESYWIKNSDTTWSYKYENPFMHLENQKLFSRETRSLWVTFAIGVDVGSPRIFNFNMDDRPRDTTGRERTYQYGVYNLKKIGINVSLENYKEYLKNYKGGLLGYGDPAAYRGICIWYEPAKTFIRFKPRIESK